MIDFADIKFTQSLSLLLFSFPALSRLYALGIIFYTRGCVRCVFVVTRIPIYIFFRKLNQNKSKDRSKFSYTFSILFFKSAQFHQYFNFTICILVISITGESQVEVRISIYAITCYRTKENPRNTEHDRSRRRQNSNKKKMNEPR